jgi:predicted ATP-dependent endonuclease of OLD family
MKLRSVHVQRFRNILDSTEVKIEDKVTCLVGKNESGKSAFLHALWRLKPARSTCSFSIPDHYPAWLEKKHRNEGIDQKDVTPSRFPSSGSQRMSSPSRPNSARVP